MEIKARLQRPYTHEQKMGFIVQYNHRLGYEIRENDEELQAWGLTEQEEAEKEAERVNNLTMTPLDFIKVLEGMGLELTQINDFLEENLEIKMQLTYCNSVYCGVVKSFLPIEIDGITITAPMVEAAFKAKEV